MKTNIYTILTDMFFAALTIAIVTVVFTAAIIGEPPKEPRELPNTVSALELQALRECTEIYSQPEINKNIPANELDIFIQDCTLDLLAGMQDQTYPDCDTDSDCEEKHPNVKF